MIYYAGYNPNTQKLIGIDSFGAFPFDAHDVRSVKLWLVREELEKYLERFPKQYEIKKVTIEVE